jgi:hypothetical protein
VSSNLTPAQSFERADRHKDAYSLRLGGGGARRGRHLSPVSTRLMSSPAPVARVPDPVSVEEQAERMPGRVEHDPHALLRLVLSQPRSRGQSMGNG